MVIVTIDISDKDETHVLDLGRKVAHSHGFARLRTAKDLIDWVFHKRALGLKVEQRTDKAWHVIVPT